VIASFIYIIGQGIDG